VTTEKPPWARRAVLPGACFVVAVSVVALRFILSDRDRFLNGFPLFAFCFSLAFAGSLLAVLGAALSGPRALLLAVLLGIALRFSMVTQRPFISDDIYRYYWDGRVAASGINPYRYAPRDPALDQLRDANGRLVNHPHMHTLYPPLAQAFFLACYRIWPGLAGIKAGLILIDSALILCLAWLLRLLKRPTRYVLLYALNPLPIIEVGHSGHLDPLGSVLLLLAVIWAVKRRWTWAGIACGLSAAGKVAGGIAAFFFLVRKRWKAAALAALVFLLTLIPFLGAGARVLNGIRTYSDKMYFNTPLFPGMEFGFRGLAVAAGVPQDMIYDVARRLALAVSGVALLAVLALQAWWRRPLLHAVRTGLGALLVLGPVLYPWYAIWILPLAIATLHPAWIAFAWASVFSYLTNVRAARGGVWGAPVWVMILEYGLLFGLGIWSHYRQRPDGSVGTESGEGPDNS